MTVPTLTRRQLNRATLARQLLLAREEVSIVDAVRRLGGLQAQEPKPPFVGLWSRVQRFEREDLHRALHEREVVRGPMMRATLHVVSADEYVDSRHAVQPVLTRSMVGALGDRAEGLDVDAVLPVARELLEQSPRTFDELRVLLSEAFPGVNDRALGYAVRTQLPLVMVPTEDRWAFPRVAAFAPAETWLGRSLAAGPPRRLLLSYLAAFGPAGAADAQTWSGLNEARGMLDELRPELAVFRDENGRELFDLPDAPRPPDDVAAPARFLPEFDNLLLAHADRTRVIADEHRSSVATKNLRIRATFLCNGVVAGTWRIERKGKAARLQIEPFETLAKKAAKDLAAEGEALLRFVEADATAFAVTVS